MGLLEAKQAAQAAAAKRKHVAILNRETPLASPKDQPAVSLLQVTMSAEKLEQFDKVLKRLLMFDDEAKSAAYGACDLERLVSYVDKLPVSMKTPELAEDPIYGHIATPKSETTYRLNKRTAYYWNHLHNEVMKLRGEGWTFRRIEEYVQKERKAPYKYTKEQLFRLLKKFTK